MEPNTKESDTEDYYRGQHILAIDADRMITYTPTMVYSYTRDSLDLGWVLEYSMEA